MRYYEVLGIAADADDAAVRQAYLARAREHHPDTGGDAAAMTALNEAWAVLSDPVRRRRYDREVGVARPAPWVAPAVDAEVDDDSWDDRPIREARLPALVPLVPPAIFLFAVLVGCMALVLDSPAVLGFAVVLFSLSCVAVAVVALLTLRGSVRR